ncbi:hypothetical protein TSUD_333500 [Trifolium subterraneum]|uniref:Uncharacterized protein n=1 Tax=Trifolium subterraneum TaxID=3900 RepID=A0A2Z6NT67_TRISU|nr:hypothetical protein TSUD_333500 [Trifolium subterraneum]
MSRESDTVFHGVTWPNYEPMELDTTVLHGVTRPNSEPKPIQLKPALTYEPILVKSMSEEARYEFLMRECYKGLECYVNQSYYDPLPPSPLLFGGSPVYPIDITDEDHADRPMLKKFSELALEYYYNKKGASFEFHDLVKYALWYDARFMAIYTGLTRPDPTEHYITFQAKAKGDTSSCPAITTFQAKILEREDDKDKPPVVEECRIKK